MAWPRMVALEMTWDTLRGRADGTCAWFGCWGESPGMTLPLQSLTEALCIHRKHDPWLDSVFQFLSHKFHSSQLCKCGE